MSEPEDLFTENIIQKTAEALVSNYFDARVFSDRKGLISAVMEHVTPGTAIGIGGSLTVRGIGLMEELAKQKIQVLDHWKGGISQEEISSIRLGQLTCDLFLTSANAITEKGDIVNTDGFGNRINAMTFGPKKVIIIAGFNKIVPDVDGALKRIREIAAPFNAKMLNLPLPCAETGYCHDCKSELRICRITSIMQRKPGGTDISVYLINEKLGL